MSDMYICTLIATDVLNVTYAAVIVSMFRYFKTGTTASTWSCTPTRTRPPL